MAEWPDVPSARAMIKRLTAMTLQVVRTVVDRGSNGARSPQPEHDRKAPTPAPHRRAMRSLAHQLAKTTGAYFVALRPTGGQDMRQASPVIRDRRVGGGTFCNLRVASLASTCNPWVTQTDATEEP